MIDHAADRPVYKQLADTFREDIERGVLPPGFRFPAEPRVADEHGVGRDTVRAAFALLRAEGLVRTEWRIGTYVADRPERTTMTLEPGDTFTVRKATEAERKRHGIPESVPVLDVRRAGGERMLLRADHHDFSVADHTG